MRQKLKSLRLKVYLCLEVLDDIQEEVELFLDVLDEGNESDPLEEIFRGPSFKRKILFSSYQESTDDNPSSTDSDRD